MVAVRRAAALLAILLAGPATAAEYDVAWFERNAQARASWLSACLNDARSPRRICQNAERAETKVRARALARDGGLPPEFLTPFARDAIAVACARPPSQRGLLGRNCRKT